MEPQQSLNDAKDHVNMTFQIKIVSMSVLHPNCWRFRGKGLRYLYHPAQNADERLPHQ